MAGSASLSFQQWFRRGHFQPPVATIVRCMHSVMEIVQLLLVLLPKEGKDITATAAHLRVFLPSPTGSHWLATSPEGGVSLNVVV